jgi:hypothetical protein
MGREGGKVKGKGREIVTGLLSSIGEVRSCMDPALLASTGDLLYKG